MRRYAFGNGKIKDANSFKMQRFYHAFVGLTRSLVRVSRPIDRNNGSILYDVYGHPQCTEKGCTERPALVVPRWRSRDHRDRRGGWVGARDRLIEGNERIVRRKGLIEGTHTTDATDATGATDAIGATHETYAPEAPTDRPKHRLISRKA